MRRRTAPPAAVYFDGWVHPMHVQLGTSRGVKLFFCYCCGQHEWQHYCVCCGSRACDRCLQWMYPCSEHGDTWCINQHVALKECPHVGARDARSL